MARYFKIVEIDRDSFVEATGEDLGFYSQMETPMDGYVYAAIDDSEEYELSVSLECFSD